MGIDRGIAKTVLHVDDNAEILETTAKYLHARGLRVVTASSAFGVTAEHMYTRGPPAGAARAFIDFVLSPAIQGSVLEHGGFISIAAMKVARDHD